METFVPYILLSALYFALLYLAFRAFLAKETFFRFNRKVLLLGSLCCLTVPLLGLLVTTYSDQQTPYTQTPHIELEETGAIEDQAAELHGYHSLTDKTPSTHTVWDKLSWAGLLLIAYVVGGIGFFTALCASCLRMWLLTRKGSRLINKDYTLIIMPHDVGPFSWGRYIVLSASDFHNNRDEILTHEVAHLKYRHYIDNVFMEMTLLIQWFNPFVWLLKSELKNIHEYEADEYVLRSGINVRKYQLLLVRKAVGARSYALANGFNQSKIKKRIAMMLKQKSKKSARFKLLLLLALGALTTYSFNYPEVSEPVRSFASEVNVDELLKTLQKKAPEKKAVYPVVIDAKQGREDMEAPAESKVPEKDTAEVNEPAKPFATEVNADELLKTPQKTAPEKKAVYTVVIDAGHGGKDAGGKANEVLEKDLTLALSHLLKEKLDAQKSLRVLLTRDKDESVALVARSNLAKRHNADLLISLHVNSSTAHAKRTGIECYIDTAATKKQESEQVATRVLGELEKLDGISTSKAVQHAPLAVLRGSQCPAILLELGSIDDEGDLSFITDAKNQRQICDRIAAAIPKILGDQY